MSNNDIKRPQRIWAPQELAPAPPAEPVQPPAKAAERFGRLLQSSRAGDPAATARGVARQAGALSSALSNALGMAAPKRAPVAPRKDNSDASAHEAASADTAPTEPRTTQAVHAKVTQPDAMSWSQAEPWQQAWRESAAAMPQIEGVEAQHWPQDVAATAITLCQRAGDQFTSWRVAVPLDPEALPETELWLEASPQRLSLRFRSLSAWSVRLILIHEERLVSLLKQRLGSSRDVDVDIT
jgi:Type III secretion protein (HpaP)